MLTAHTRVDRQAVIDWYRKNRARTAALFDAIAEEAYYAQPIALRHPIVFYEGHLPAFSLNTLVKKGLGGNGIDAELERLFARGIDPDETDHDRRRTTWPNRADVRAFADAADELVIDALSNAPIEQSGHPLLHNAQAVYAILEHEAMHQETLLYMWHRLPHLQKHAPANYMRPGSGSAVDNEDIDVPSGRTTLGAHREAIPFGWDNEFGPVSIDVPAFSMDSRNVSNGDYLEFIEAGGYTKPELWNLEDWRWVSEQPVSNPVFWERRGDEWFWRGMFESFPLPLDWPVYVSHAEASAYARWRVRRLPTEAEYQRAAFGAPDNRPRAFPWGDAAPDASRGVFDFASWDPHPVGSHPAGASAWGIHDLVGNGWEWTSSVFAPFPGFEPLPSYPEYSADFFDNSHFVMKGASPATARELLRPTFRNWFRPRYPFVYATLRTVGEAA